MGAERQTTSASRLTRIVPILGWSRRYDRRWLRGDLIAGIAVAAMIVPKNLGYAGIAGIPVENGLYAAAAAAIIYATLLHVAAHLDRAELVARGGGRRRGAGDRPRAGSDAAQLVAAIALVTGAPVPPGRHPQAGVARAASCRGRS